MKRGAGVPHISGERLADRHTPALQFDMYQRQTVDQDGHIIAVIVLGTIIGGYGVLVDNLQNIVVDILLINQHNILAFAIIPLQHLYMILLDQTGLFRNVRIRIGQYLLEESIPLDICEFVPIHLGKLCPEVGDKVRNVYLWGYIQLQQCFRCSAQRY